ncbi:MULTISPECIES: SH3 domain-containing protein [Staphylococcus]|nr:MULTISPECIES: SH3 domain-containing protein [Staphylococcus]MDT0678970.1 SH3 domain-containing protein [Staphylococcus chromogenes]
MNKKSLMTNSIIVSGLLISNLFTTTHISFAKDLSNKSEHAVNGTEETKVSDDKEKFIDNLKKQNIDQDKISFVKRNWEKMSKNDIYEYLLDVNQKQKNINTFIKNDDVTQKTSAYTNEKKLFNNFSAQRRVKLTKEQLISLGWIGSLSETDINQLNAVLNKYHIDSPEKIAHFLSQVMAESGNGVYTYELGDANYLSYLDYMLGNNGPGQGAFYRGAGYLQLTGKNNYRSFASYINDNNVLTKGYSYVSKTYPWESAAWFFSIHSNANTLAGNGATVEEITRIINGGYNALEKRRSAYQRAKSIFNSSNIYDSLSDTGYNPDSKVSDWMKTDSGVTFRYENGVFNVTKKDGVAVYGYPDNDGKMLDKLKVNDTVTYDYKYVNDGYVWISYVKNNKRYYAQVGFSDNHTSFKPQTQPFGNFNKVNIENLSYSDTIFDKNAKMSQWRQTDSGITFRNEMGRFKVTKDSGVAIYSEPNNDGKQFDTLKKGQYLIYDYKYVNDGYVWIGFEKNGKRYYAQTGFSDGKNNYKPNSDIFGVFF